MKLIRDKENEFGTFGTMQLPSGEVVQTLERKWLDNQSNISCIPTGIYKCEIVKSPKFGRVYEIKDVPNRTHILFHKGNWLKDTNGCVLIGSERANDGISKSKLAFDKFMQEMHGKPFCIEIIEAAE